MGYFRQNLRALAWLASLAILLSALMPTIAQAVDESLIAFALAHVRASRAKGHSVPTGHSLPEPSVL